MHGGAVGDARLHASHGSGRGGTPAPRAQKPLGVREQNVHCRQRRKRTYTCNTYGGGEDFAESFAPPLVLFIAENQAQQLEQQMRKVEVAPRWRYFEYVLNSDSTVNSMLETALRSVTQSLPRVVLLRGQACIVLVRIDPKSVYSLVQARCVPVGGSAVYSPCQARCGLTQISGTNSRCDGRCDLFQPQVCTHFVRVPEAPVYKQGSR